MKRRRGNTRLSTGASRLLSASVLVVIVLFAGILVYSMVDRLLLRPPVESGRADLKPPTKVEDVIQISVRNECGAQDVAMAFTDFLRKRGFDVVETTNGNRFDRKFTTVVNSSGNYENALRVAEALGVNKEYVITKLDPESYVDVEVLIGTDYANLKPKMGME